MRNKKIGNNPKLLIVMLFLFPFFVAGLVFLGSRAVYGQLPPGAIGVFGGLILDVTQCTCTGGNVIDVGPPRAARVYFVPGFSILYEYFQIKKPGAWVLGTYSPPTPCLKLVCPCGKLACCCVIVPHQGNIQIVGTSR